MAQIRLEMVKKYTPEVSPFYKDDGLIFNII